MHPGVMDVYLLCAFTCQICLAKGSVQGSVRPVFIDVYL